MLDRVLPAATSLAMSLSELADLADVTASPAGAADPSCRHATRSTVSAFMPTIGPSRPLVGTPSVSVRPSSPAACLPPPARRPAILPFRRGRPKRPGIETRRCRCAHSSTAGRLYAAQRRISKGRAADDRAGGYVPCRNSPCPRRLALTLPGTMMGDGTPARRRRVSS